MCDVGGKGVGAISTGLVVRAGIMKVGGAGVVDVGPVVCICVIDCADTAINVVYSGVVNLVYGGALNVGYAGVVDLVYAVAINVVYAGVVDLVYTA